VWSEASDGGLSRAAFPFVLTNPYSNATHNGLATFLYDDIRVSAIWYQAVRAQFATELQRQTPIRLWSAIPGGAQSPWLRSFDGDAAPEQVSASGLIIDVVLYLHDCETRWGPHPDCRHMRHGAFSVTKSLGAAVALLRLAQTYGEQVFTLKITDYVPVTATHDGWARVTFADALDMATSIGDKVPQREPHAPLADVGTNLRPFLQAPTAKQTLAQAFLAGQYPWGSGEVLRYNNLHAFVLAAAMDAFLLSFWSVPYRTTTGCTFQIPYMLGYGGNLVVLLPNGISAFGCADGFHFDLESMVLAGETIRPFPCPAGSAAMRPPAGSPLEAADLRAELPRHTFCQDPTTNFPDVFGGRLAMFVAADGTFTSTPTSVCGWL
jgi:hypothetical protein